MAYDSATGKLIDEFGITDPAFPKDFGRVHPIAAPHQLIAVGNHLILLTETHMFRLDLTTKQITIEWKK